MTRESDRTGYFWYTTLRGKYLHLFDNDEPMDRHNYKILRKALCGREYRRSWEKTAIGTLEPITEIRGVWQNWENMCPDCIKRLKVLRDKNET